MRSLKTPLCSTVIAVLLAAAGASERAEAQQCTPAWNYTIPGVDGSGYVGAFTKYDGDLVVSGSFQSIGGAPGTKYLARYNLTSGTWSSFGLGLGDAPSNSFGTSFAHFRGDLIVGGFFADANGVADTKSIARWDGTQFNSLGTGWPFDSVNQVQSLLATNVFGPEWLFVGGGFATIGGQPAANIAIWTGSEFSPIASTMTLSGINPVVFSMAVFDDGQGGGPQLYIGGRFADVDGVPAKMIARWNGGAWSAVGTNLSNTIATGEIDSMLVWDDGTGPALYVGGTNIRVNGTLAQVAKWNGVTWTAVGQNPTGRVWSLAAFDDGSGEKLYAGGTPLALGRVFRLEGSTWTTVEGGADAQVIRLFPDGDRLYMGGSFSNVNSVPASRIVYRTSCAAVCPCVADTDDGTGTGVCDGGVGIEDLLYYLGIYDAGVIAADVDDGSATGTPDGGVGIEDLLYYLQRYDAGC